MGYMCPYCRQACFDNGSIVKTYYLSHGSSSLLEMSEEDTLSNAVEIKFKLCPNCGKTSIDMRPYCRNESMRFSFSYPQAEIISIPDYIPLAIQNDYLEAVAICELSPKASATLSRRCLQGMIHDFWGIKEKNLNAEITSLKGRIPAAQWSAIDALRKIGNIGAHMEKDINIIVDVDPDEAKTLIKLIELLIDKWYIARHDEEALLANITSIGNQKDSERKSDVTPPVGK